ncbi:MAG: hypothetical protein LR001_02050 [Clostridiales bacterium]|nr:hypothetical protein [Clostridiales bacterium]
MLKKSKRRRRASYYLGILFSLVVSLLIFQYLQGGLINNNTLDCQEKSFCGDERFFVTNDGESKPTSMAQNYEQKQDISGCEIFRFGEVTVNTDKREISFYGTVYQDEEMVNFLVHLVGYGWLKESSAIVSEAKLLDLQLALAYFDWKRWDALWFGENREWELPLFISWNDNEISSTDIIITDFKLGLDDLIFLGSPYFDPIFLTRRHYCLHICLESCPLLFTKEQVNKKLEQNSKELGYQLKAGSIPLLNTKVRIIIRVPVLDR